MHRKNLKPVILRKIVRKTSRIVEEKLNLIKVRKS